MFKEKIKQMAMDTANKKLEKEMSKLSFNEAAGNVLNMAKAMKIPQAKLKALVVRGARIDIIDGIKANKTDTEIMQPFLDSLNYQALLKLAGMTNANIEYTLKHCRPTNDTQKAVE